jgi:hypothetical protein
MNERHSSEQLELARVGLCASCRHVQRVSARSTFYLCSRSFVNPAFLKYPPLPVVKCDGFEKVETVANG